MVLLSSPASEYRLLATVAAEEVVSEDHISNKDGPQEWWLLEMITINFLLEQNEEVISAPKIGYIHLCYSIDTTTAPIFNTSTNVPQCKTTWALIIKKTGVTITSYPYGR